MIASMFAHAPAPAPAPARYVDRPPLRVVRRRPGTVPDNVRAAAAYCAGLTAGSLAVAIVSAPTGDAGGVTMLALLAGSGLAAALAAGRHHARRAAATAAR